MQHCYSSFSWSRWFSRDTSSCGLQQLPVWKQQLLRLQMLTLAAGLRLPCPEQCHGGIVSDATLHN